MNSSNKSGGSGQSKLGRGLSALLGNSKINLPNQQQVKFDSGQVEQKNLESVLEIELSKIVAGAFQPRSIFKSENLDSLANSIKESGVFQPITVRPIKNDKFEIIAGERRFRATKIAGLKKIPAIIRKIDDNQALELAIVENVQRDDLLPNEEAEGYKRLMSEFSYTQEDVAKKIGKSRSHIANLLRLLTLPSSVLKLLNEQKLSMGHARALVGIKNAEELANLVVKNGLNVRQIEELSADVKKSEKPKSNKNQSAKPSHKQILNPKDLFFKIEKKLNKEANLKAKIEFNKSKKSGELIIKFSDPKQLEKLFVHLF